MSVNICWPNDEDRDLPKVYRGPWVGHRFEIMTLESLHLSRPLSEGKEWKDISDGMCDKIKDYWIESFGDQWKEKLWIRKVDKVWYN